MKSDPALSQARGESLLRDGYLPSEAVLGRSEFLEPLSEGQLALYRRLLAGSK